MIKLWWKSTGCWGWLTSFLVLSALILAFGYNTMFFMTIGWQQHGTKVIGDVEISLVTQGDIAPGKYFQVRLEGLGDETGKIGIPPTLSPITKDIQVLVPEGSEAIDLVVALDDGEASWHLGRLLGETPH